MSLLKEIKLVDRRAASVLEKAKLLTDSAILSLTREDLRDLFPGAQDFQLRRTLSDTIHKQPMAEQLLKKLKGFIPHESLRAALTNNGVLVDYLQLMKDMRTHMDDQRSFIDAHICFLEELSPDQKYSPQTDGCSREAGGPVGHPGVQSGGYSEGEQALHSSASDVDYQKKLPAGSTGASHETEESFSILDFGEPLLYEMVVSGKTFDHHKDLMEKVKKQVKDRIRLNEDKQDYKLTFVFCPISSRIGTDVEAAMADIRGDKPIILVLMHHTHKVKPVTSMKIWPEGANVVLRVNVFFHETTGLLKCKENEAAVVEIKNILLQRFN